MPLTRHQEEYAERFEGGINFAMTDGKARLVCNVSREALDDRAAKDRKTGGLRKLFTDYREEVEQAASDHFDAGRITGGDIQVWVKSGDF
jgi:hypothetical protein